VSIDRGGPRHEKGLGVSIRHGVVAAVAVAVASSGALSGCSDADSEPPDSGLPAKSELTESPPSPSPTSGPQEPRLPAAAKAPGKAGAKAFVAYYIRLLNYASHTGDTQSVRRYGSSCRGCNADATFFEHTYEHGGWLEGDTWTPIPSSWILLGSGKGYFVGVNLKASKGRELLRRSGTIKTFPAGRIGRDFRVVHDGQGWTVKSMEEPL
jgi:hypothetical protein